MTVTLAEDCTQATIASDLITTYSNDFPNSDDLTLTVEYNCGDGTTIELTDENLDLIENEYVLEPSAIGQSDSLCDGIYNLVLTTTDDEGETTKEYYCLFVNCTIKCDILDYVANNLDSNIYGLYEILTWLTTCEKPECKCSNACLIYDKIIELINEDAAANDCKCG